MKKINFLIIILLFSTGAFAQTYNYKGIVKIEMDVIRNGKIIGYSNYFFEHDDKKMTVPRIRNENIFNVLAQFMVHLSVR